MSLIDGVRAVSIPVSDQDAALAFYTQTLGCEVVRDVIRPDGGRWIELSPGGATVVTLEPLAAAATRYDGILVRFATRDAASAHAALRAAGVEVGDLLHWPGAPPIFALLDPDGNRLSITEIG
jgi:lactoylglutathione lyase